ncbi:MAG: hypothetical protein AAB590_00415, partial [Patescibacteria group bacterium]
RITAAIYRLTDFWDMEEPARFELRKQANKLLDAILSFTGSLETRPALTIKDITDRQVALQSFFTVLNLGEQISRTNYEIIKDELLSLMILVEKYFAVRFGYLVSISDFLKSAEIDKFVLRSSALHGQIVDGKIPANNTGSSIVNNTDRKSQILNFVRKNGPSSIRDIAVMVKGCSEKTIQRELITLINSGLLKREGERRWSKYFAIGPL